MGASCQALRAARLDPVPDTVWAACAQRLSRR
jgi:hypothetical protein